MLSFHDSVYLLQWNKKMYKVHYDNKTDLLSSLCLCAVFLLTVRTKEYLKTKSQISSGKPQFNI